MSVFGISVVFVMGIPKAHAILIKVQEDL